MMEQEYFQQPMPLFQGYGINSAYATPAYMANFRPAYAHQGDPGNPYATGADGSANAGRLMDTFIPFPFSNHTSYNIDPLTYSAATSNDINNMIGDNVMGIGQRVGIAAAAWYGINKLADIKMRAPAGSMWSKASQAQAYAGAFARGQGMSGAAAAAAGAAGTYSLGTATGTFLGRAAGSVLGAGLSGASRAIGLGAAPALAASVTSGASVVGGVVGGFALPFLGSVAAAKVVGDQLGDPYVAMRRSSDALLANTANTYVGGSSPTSSGRFGMSHLHAQNLSRMLTDAGTQDFAFEKQDYGIMADYGMRSGLFNDVGNLDSETMKRRVESMAKSVKLIMAVANTDSMKEAVDYLSRLKAGGISDPGVASRLISSLGVSSALSGTSVEQLMNTVGNQTQMMFQRDGLLPSMGQTVGASIYGGFANAYKSGLISSETMSTVGGVEGATQNFIEGSLGLMKSPLATMALMTDRNFNGGPTGLVDTRAAFGQRAATDPFGTMGDMTLNRDFYASKRMERDGMVSTTWNMIEGMIAHLPAQETRGKDGKYDWQKVAGVLSKMGMGDEQIRSMTMMFGSAIDDVSLNRSRQAISANSIRTIAQSANQEGMLLNGLGVGRAWYAARGAGKDVQEGIFNPIAGAATRAIANVSDGGERMLNAVSGITAPEDLPWYRTEGNKRTKYELFSKDFRDNFSTAPAGFDPTRKIPSATSTREGLDTFRYMKYAAPLMDNIYGFLDDKGEKGDLARELLKAMKNKGEGVNDLTDKLMSFNDLTKGSAINADAYGGSVYDTAEAYSKWIRSGNMGVKESSVKTDEEYHAKINKMISDAVAQTREDTDSSFWSRSSTIDRDARNRSAGYSSGEKTAIGDVLSEMTEGLYTNGKTVSDVATEVLTQSGLKEAMAKDPKDRTKEEQRMIDQVRAVGQITGISQRDLDAVAKHGKGDGLRKLQDHMTSNKDDMDQSVVDTLQNVYKKNKNSPYVLDILAGKDDNVRRNLSSYLNEDTIENLTPDIIRGLSSATNNTIQGGKEQAKLESSSELLSKQVSNIAGSMKDFKEVTESMRGFGSSISSSASRFDAAASKIERAADTMNESAKAARPILSPSTNTNFTWRN